MLIELPIAPGVITDNTDLLSEGRWIDADKVRFEAIGGKSHAEVIGGYEDLSEDTFDGKGRGIHRWVNLQSEELVAIGTTERVYIFTQGILWDITPIRASATLSDKIDTTDTDATITVVHTAHGLLDGARVYLHNGTTVGGVDLGVDGTLASGSIQTIAGSKTLVITETAHGLATNERITFASATAVGGVGAGAINTTHTVYVVDPNTFLIHVATAATSSAAGGGTPTYIGLKEYPVTVVDVDTYTVEAASAATSTASTGGGTITYQYAINPGRETTVKQAGYSTGTYSSGYYSLPTSESDLRARSWVFSNYGEDLVMNYRGSALYRWENALSVRATINAATDAPTQTLSHMVTPERFLMCLGTEEATGSTYDPLQVAWARQEQGFATNDWTPTATNTAGDIRLSEGSRIIAGVSMPFVSLIWTDTALYAAQYLQDTTFIYGFNLLGTSCGLIGPKAWARAGDSGQVFWISSTREFMVWQGATPVTIQCPVSDHFFDNLAPGQEDLIYAGVNEKFNEVWWFYPTTDANENARYVAFNFAEAHWTIGTFSITAWAGRGVGEFPIALWANGKIRVHEKGTSANGDSLEAFAETGLMDLKEGENHLMVRRYVPDFADMTGSVDVSLKHRMWPQGAVSTQSIGTATATTEKLDFRLTTRQVGIRFDWNAVPTDGRIGRILFDVLPTGRTR